MSSFIHTNDGMIQCPYNKSHIIIKQRFQVHLVRCRKSYLNAEVVVCPFDITHRINKQELDWHVSNCPNRRFFEIFKTCDPCIPGFSSTNNKSFSGKYRERSNIETEAADWDNDPDVPSYNPTDYVEKSQILRQPVGLQPAQRVVFREAERKRLHSLMNKDIYGEKKNLNPYS